MKAVLIVGDSHAAGLRRAGRNLHLPLDLSFFAHPSHVDAHLGQLQCIDDRLEMKSADSRLISTTGDRFFRPDDYDAVVLVGLRTELPYSLWNGWDGHRAPGDGETISHISAAVQHLALDDYIREQALSYNVAIKIRSISDCRVIVIPNPYVSVALRDTPIPTAPGIIPRGLVRADRISYEKEKLDRWNAVFREAFEQLGAQVLFQPEVTTVEHIFTKRDYCAGESSPALMRHMNDAFGQLVLSQLIDCLGTEVMSPRIVKASR